MRLRLFLLKWLGVLLRSPKEEGFTLVELVVVIVIIGILAAFAFPSYLNRANQARQSEAQTYIGALNSEQQTFYQEQGRFGAMEELAVTFDTETANYRYTTRVVGSGLAEEAISEATPISASVQGVAGRVYLQRASNGVATFTILCPGPPGAVPALSGATECPPTEP